MSMLFPGGAVEALQRMAMKPATTFEAVEGLFGAIATTQPGGLFVERQVLAECGHGRVR